MILGGIKWQESCHREEVIDNSVKQATSQKHQENILALLPGIVYELLESKDQRQKHQFSCS